MQIAFGFLHRCSSPIGPPPLPPTPTRPHIPTSHNPAEVPVAATGIAYNLSTIAYMVPYGLALAMSTRVGNLLGAGRPTRAKLAAEVGACARALVQCRFARMCVTLCAYVGVWVCARARA